MNTIINFATSPTVSYLQDKGKRKSINSSGRGRQETESSRTRSDGLVKFIKG
jgi:hypothetical protein